MKILFLVQHLLSGGAERTVAYVSSYLSENDFDVTVLSISNSVFYQLNDKTKFKTLNISHGYKNLFDRILKNAKRHIEIKKFLKHNKYDVIFCIIPNVAKYILHAHKKVNFKLITSERNNPDIELYEGEKKLKEKVFKQSDGIIFQTQRAKEYYPKDIQNKGMVIHNAIGNELVYEISKIDQKKKKISAIGRISEQKDYPTLLKAFKLVLEKHPEYVLEIYGNDSRKSMLNDLVEQLGIRESLIFKGVQKDAIIQAADSTCYVLSSKYEGMPNALMEAMAVGLPCVSTDCPNGPAELIRNGENGLLVPVGDIHALSDAIIKMIEDISFAKKCGENAKKILETHSIEIKAREYMDYILKIYNEE